MNTVSITTFAAVAMLTYPVTAVAEQYAIEAPTTVTAASAGLLETLKIKLIDAVAINGRYFTILEAPNEAYLEAFVRATNARPLAMYVLEADWAGAGLTSLPIEAREPFLLLAPCAFCSS